MACGKCGAKKGHLPGCPALKGPARGHGKGLLRGEKSHKCRTCDGDGFITRNFRRKGKWESEQVTCPDCDGTGEVPTAH